MLNLLNGKEEIGRIMGGNRTYSFTIMNNRYLKEFTFRRFTETYNQNFYDSIFVINFNNQLNGKRHGIWLDCDLTTEEIVNKLYTWKPKKNKHTQELVFEYPWKIYEQGQLIETQYYCNEGDLITRVSYNGLDSTVINYEYKLLIDSNIISVDSPHIISSNDTVTFYYRIPYETTLVYENSELKQKISPHLKTEHYSSGPPLNSSGIETITIPFTIEKGEFREITLYNGTIEYYDKNANLTKISTVINGEEHTANKP